MSPNNMNIGYSSFQDEDCRRLFWERLTGYLPQPVEGQRINNDNNDLDEDDDLDQEGHLEGQGHQNGGYGNDEDHILDIED